MKNYLYAKKLKKCFLQNSINFNVLNDIDFTFKQSECYAITGVSGTGKSTLIHLLAGIDAPTQGIVYYNENDIYNFSQDEKNQYLNNTIGLVFQEPYLIKELTVVENIMLKGLIKKINYKDCKEYAISLLRKIGLEGKANQLPCFLSVGEQQRIAILRAIFNKPKFLLADEPTANLDHANVRLIINLLLQFQNEWDMGIILTTHDNYVAQSMKNKLQIKEGSLLTLTSNAVSM